MLRRAVEGIPALAFGDGWRPSLLFSVGEQPLARSPCCFVVDIAVIDDDLQVDEVVGSLAAGAACSVQLLGYLVLELHARYGVGLGEAELCQYSCRFRGFDHVGVIGCAGAQPVYGDVEVASAIGGFGLRSGHLSSSLRVLCSLFVTSPLPLASSAASIRRSGMMAPLHARRAPATFWEGIPS